MCGPALDVRPCIGCAAMADFGQTYFDNFCVSVFWPNFVVDGGCCCVGVLLFCVAGARTRQPENSKRAHFRAPALQNTTKIPREDPERHRKVAGKGRKKAQNFGPPTSRGPTLRGPTIFSWFGPPSWAPPFGAPPFWAGLTKVGQLRLAKVGLAKVGLCRCGSVWEQWWESPRGTSEAPPTSQCVSFWHLVDWV